MLIAGIGGAVEMLGDSEPELSHAELAISLDDPELRASMIQEKKNELRYVVAFVSIGFTFLAASRFVPEGKWSNIYGIATMVFGALMCVGLPFAILLFIAWLKPETQAYFATEEAWRMRHRTRAR